MPQSEGKKVSDASSYWRTVLVFVLALLNLWHLAVEHVERKEKKELLQIKAALLDEVKSLSDRLDAQLLREAEAKSDFDLFNEQYLKSRKNENN